MMMIMMLMMTHRKQVLVLRSESHNPAAERPWSSNIMTEDKTGAGSSLDYSRPGSFAKALRSVLNRLFNIIPGP